MLTLDPPPHPPTHHLHPPQDESAKQWQAELRVIGDLSLAPPSLQAAAARLMQGSRESGPTRAVVNICFPYTSSQELQHTADEICGGLGASFLLQHDVGPSLLHRVMHTKVRVREGAFVVLFWGAGRVHMLLIPCFVSALRCSGEGVV